MVAWLTLQVSYTTTNLPRLQFPLIVGYYTGDFRSAKPEAATDYLILLSLNADLPGAAGLQQANLCLEALRELVLETREFALLLGDIRQDGQKIAGAIETRAKLIRHTAADRSESVEEFITSLTVKAAIAADESGRVTDAVLLYHLAGEYDNVLTIVNRTLSEALTVELGEEGPRLEPLKPRNTTGQENAANSTLSLTTVDDPMILASNILALYTGPSRRMAFNNIKRQSADALALLIRMAHAKQELLARQYISCVETIGNTGLLPLSASGSVNEIRQHVNTFNELPPVVARVIGDLLVWAVIACSQERERLMKDNWEVDSRKATAQRLATAISDLNLFAGLVRYKLRQGVFDVLANIVEQV
jgi:nuclear pore complex protein Nup93